MEQMSVKQYAEKVGVKRQSILYRMSVGLYLPGVHNIKKVSKAYILEVDPHLDVRSAKKSFRKK